MGNLLKLLSRDETPKYDVFVDFENAQPSESEKDTYLIVQEVLQHSRDVLQELQMYKGAGNEIRMAIANPRNATQQIRAWESVLPLVYKLRQFYEFSQHLGNKLES
ncbi:protein FAM49A-like, partial [Limulus polyphemus]|uniref:Protein FAM49A-like n=1 Tax=Limulus polyphemus TaxID=6850 RepID=A0ABM1BVG2_LIMPO